MATPHPPNPQAATHIRTAGLVLLAILLTVFTVLNRSPVYIWPFGTHPVALAIAITFVLGALIGWLVRGLLPTSRPASRNSTVDV